MRDARKENHEPNKSIRILMEKNMGYFVPLFYSLVGFLLLIGWFLLIDEHIMWKTRATGIAT